MRTFPASPIRQEPRLPAFPPFGSTYSSYTHTSENGLMSNGGLSFTYGSRETTDKFDSTSAQQSQNRSMVGSTNGNLTLKAGRNALVSGSDIVAAQDINMNNRGQTTVY